MTDRNEVPRHRSTVEFALVETPQKLYDVVAADLDEGQSTFSRECRKFVNVATVRIKRVPGYALFHTQIIQE
jgi:hypothetical protein